MSKRAMIVAAACALAVALPSAQASVSKLLIVEGSIFTPPTAELSPYFAQIDTFDVKTAVPSMALLGDYDGVLIYTDTQYQVFNMNKVALGNLMADYVDSGGVVMVASFGSTPGGLEIPGRFATTGYNPFVVAGADNLSGMFNVLMPADPAFAGVNTAALTYFNNPNMAEPGLDAGAVVLADDGQGTPLLALNASESVAAMNAFPGVISGNNAELYHLMANTINRLTPLPEPASLALLGLAAAALWRRR